MGISQIKEQSLKPRTLRAFLSGNKCQIKPILFIKKFIRLCSTKQATKLQISTWSTQFLIREQKITNSLKKTKALRSPWFFSTKGR